MTLPDSVILIERFSPMKIVLGVVVGLVIGFLAMSYFKTGHLPF